MAEIPTTGELVKAKAILADKVNAAVDAVLANPNFGAYPMGGGYMLDLARAVAANRFTALVMGDVHAGKRHKRSAVRTAILLARPERG